MATFLNDTFTDSDSTALDAHTGETGATWTEHPQSGQTASVQSNSARADSGTLRAVYYASGSPASADYEVSAVIDIVSTGRHGPIGRVDGTAETYYWARANSADLQLIWAVAGTLTQLGSTISAAVSDGQTITLKMVGTTISVWLDGVEKISVTDGTITAAGKAGILVSNQTTTGIDSVTAADIVIGGVGALAGEAGGLAGRGGSLAGGPGRLARSMEQLNGIWRPDRKIIRPRLVPVGIALQGA